MTITPIARVINMTNIGSGDSFLSSFLFSILFISLQIFATYFTIAQYPKSLILSVTTNKRKKAIANMMIGNSQRFKNIFIATYCSF